MYNNIIIFFILFILYLYEYQKESFIIDNSIKPFIQSMPTNNIAIVSFYCSQDITYELYSIDNYKHYTTLYNHALYIFNIPKNISINEKISIKYQAINYVLNKSNHQYVIWINLSSIFNNLDINIKTYLLNYKNYDIIISNNTLIFKNTKYTKNIIYNVLNCKHLNKNLQFNNLIKNNKKIIFLPKNKLSFEPTKNNIQNNSFILDFNNYNKLFLKKIIFNINNKLDIV